MPRTGSSTCPRPDIGWSSWPRTTIRSAQAIPEDAPRGSWFLTADPAACGDRRAGVRSMLIGPREDGPRTTRCDATARDVRDAVLEILAADAMG